MALKKLPKGHNTTYTLDRAMEAVARSLREFGYSDVTAKMTREIYDAWKDGKRFPELPHGVIGGFAESQFSEIGAEALARLPS